MPGADQHDRTRAALAVVIAEHRAELDLLELIADRLAIADELRCDLHGDRSPCSGDVYTRWCRRCADLVRRCADHGGLLAATADLGGHVLAHHAEKRAAIPPPPKRRKR